jgi:phosphoglycerate dehydrogenase-like enzyme
MKVINQYGFEVSERIRAEVPGVEVVDLGADEVAPDGLVADALFTWNRRDWRQLIDLAELHHVKWVQINGAGGESIPPDLIANGRVLTTGRTAGAIAISEFVLASMLAFAKRFPLTWIQEPPATAPRFSGPRGFLGYPATDIAWAPPPRWRFAPLLGLHGKTLGLVGFGGIAQAVARRALAFEMRVLAVRRHLTPSPVPGVEMVPDLRDMLPHADHLVLAVSLTPSTHHVLNDETLGLLKRGAHIVNISRGGNIDQNALRRALDDGRVAFASLDVQDPEPLPAGHWLYSHPHVHVSPHVAWMRQEGPEIVEIFIDNLRRYIVGKPLKWVFDPSEGY